MSGAVLPGMKASHGSHDPLERHYTPDRMALQLQQHMAGWWAHHRPHNASATPRIIVEPSVGGGAHVRALRRVWGAESRFVGVDVDPQARGLQACDEAYVGDWPVIAGSLTGDLVTGNPPFSRAIDHVLAGLRVAPVVAFILPLNLLGVAKWAPIVGPGAPLHTVLVTTGRAWPKSVRETAMFVWRRGYVGSAELVRLAPWAM